ncbi:hypothetical protein LINGRAHAP2_LOCUS36501 [Linum grandiflorum]
MPTNSSTVTTSSVTLINTFQYRSGRVSSELSPDDCFLDWSADTRGGGRFLLADDNDSQSKKKSSSSSSSYSRGKKLRQFVICHKIKSSSAYLKGFLLFPAAKSGFRNDESFGSSNHGKTESWSSTPDDVAGKRECFISKFPTVVGRKKKSNNNNPFGRIENYKRFEYSCTLKKRIEKEIAKKCLGFGGFSSN